MPHEGYVNPLMNNGPRFHLDMPISELAKRDTRGYDHKDEPTLNRTPATRGGSRKVGLARRPNVQSQNDGSDPREGIRTKTKKNVSKNNRRFLLQVSLSSPRSLVKPDPGNGKGSGLTRGLIRVYIHPF